MRTIILAGGYAKRLWPITLHRPKPLLPVAGVPILEHVLAKLPAGTVPILSVNRQFAPQFEAWAEGWAMRGGIPVELCVEETTAESNKLGTVGAIRYVRDRFSLDEDVLVVGGDNLVGFTFDDFLAAYRGQPLVALFDIGDLERVRRRYGVAVVDGDRITEFQEKSDDPRSTLASTACYVYPREVLARLDDYLAGEARHDAPGYFNAWLLHKVGIPFDAFVFDSAWYDIGDRHAYIEANQRYAGTNAVIPASATVKSSQIGDSVLLDDVSVRACRLRGCVIDQGCALEGVTLENALVGEGTVLRIDAPAGPG